MSLPSAERIVAGYDFLAQRYRLADRTISIAGVRAALAEAQTLAEVEADEPAALFYGFARRPRITRGAWMVLATALAVSQAHQMGLVLATEPGDLRRICTEIAGGAPFGTVRDWFAARLVTRDA